MLESILEPVTIKLAVLIDAGAGLIIALGVLQAIISALPLFLRFSQVEQAKEAVRLRLGRWLSLALEFLLAADILRTAVTPTWNEIGQLAAIIVLRTSVNFFLQKEIQKAAALAASPVAAATATSQ